MPITHLMPGVLIVVIGEGPQRMEKAEDILRFYFPDITAKSLEFAVAFLEMGWLNAYSLEAGFEEKRERQQIDAVENAIKTLWREYNALPLQLTKHERFDGQRRIAALHYDLLGHHPFAGLSPALREQLPRKQGGLAAMRAALQDGPRIHHTQRLNNAKIHLVGHARDLWREHKGTNAPRSPSGTSNPDRRRDNFYEFVSDLIQFAGKDWAPENALRLWRERYPDS
jgi:hypothetical protein